MNLVFVFKLRNTLLHKIKNETDIVTGKICLHNTLSKLIKKNIIRFFLRK